MNTITNIRLTLCLLAGLATSSVFADTLSYDAVGNIASHTSALGTTTYSYDALNRLTAETGPTGTRSYTYDANGNRLSDAGGSYTYAPTSNRIATRYGKAITTDAAGNITADGQGHTYAYNQRGYLSEARLNGVLLATYIYDYRGLRARKVTTAAAPQGAQVVRYTYDEAGHLIAETSGTGAALRTYVWRDDTPLAQIDHLPSRRIIYLETDHLNTPRVAKDQARNVVWTWDSDAFGATQPNQNPSGLGNVTINLRFPGQYYDQETGLHYNGFRYYHPGMGQYIQPDPIGLRGGSFSTYAYVGGNPLRWSDPRGLCPGCAAAGGAGVAGFGGLGGFGHGSMSGNGSKDNGDGLTDPPPKPILALPSLPNGSNSSSSSSSTSSQCPANDNHRDECKKECGEQLDRDEAECLVAKAGYGTAAQAICLGKAKMYYVQCLRSCDGK